MAQLAEVVEQLKSQQKAADKNADENVKTLDEVKGSIMQLIELQRPSFKDREGALESSRKKAKVAGTFSGSGFGSGLAKGLGVTGIMGMLGSVLSGAMAGIGTVLYGVGLAAGTAILAGGALYLAPKIGEWVAKLLENTFKDLDIPFLGNDKETKDAIRHSIGDGVKWGVYGIMIAKLLGKRFGIIFAASGWVYETINDWLTKSSATDGTWSNSLAKGWDEYFDTNNGQEMMAKIGAGIAAAIAAFAVYKTPAILRAINPFKSGTALTAAQRAAISSTEGIGGTRTAATNLASATLRPLGDNGLIPDMFDPKDLKGGPKNSPLRGSALNSRMESLARQGKFLESAIDAVTKTPWYTKVGKGLLSVAKVLEAPLIGVDVALAANNISQDPATASAIAIATTANRLFDAVTNLAGMTGNYLGSKIGINPNFTEDRDTAGNLTDKILTAIGQETRAEVIKRLADSIVPNLATGPIAPPRADVPPASYYGGQSGGAKPSQFFNSVNNQQFESFYFGGGTTMDVNDASGLALSWR